jgi:osmotically-inducible protein OsmY
MGDTMHSIGSGAACAPRAMGASAANARSRIAYGMNEAQIQAADSAGSTLDMVRDRYQRARETVAESARRALRDAGSAKRDWVNRASLAIGRDRDTNYVGPTLGAAGALVLGAGLVWLLDSRSGRSRRAWLRDKSASVLRETGDFCRRSGRYIGGRMRGAVADTRSIVRDRIGVRGEPISDERLIARIRSELGRVATNVRAIEITSRDGYVTLSGEAPNSEIDRICTIALGVRGVRGIDNRLRFGGSTSGSVATGEVGTGIDSGVTSA